MGCRYSCGINFPEQGVQLLPGKEIAAAGAGYLQEEIKTRISKNAIRFKMYVQPAQDGDNTDDPSTARPASRKKIFLNTIEITKLSDNAAPANKAISYSPNNIPDGIETADPMIIFRSKAYPISVKERQ